MRHQFSIYFYSDTNQFQGSIDLDFKNINNLVVFAVFIDW